MRQILIISLILGLSAIVGCSKNTSQEQIPETKGADTSSQMPQDSMHGHMGGAMGSSHEAMKVNTDVNLPEKTAAAWKGAVVRVQTRDGQPQDFKLNLGELTPLGETGLKAKALAFVPDFVMDDNGITTRSEEAKNPALEIQISEEGKPDYRGWLFGAMPDVHPFPHDKYSVTLVEGIPSN